MWVSPEVAQMHGRGGVRAALPLPGWDQRSIWGWDDQEMSLFAQLWRNGDNRDEPQIWITPGAFWGGTGVPEVLAARIAAAADCTDADALAALANSLPSGIPGDRLRALAG